MIRPLFPVVLLTLTLAGCQSGSITPVQEAAADERPPSAADASAAPASSNAAAPARSEAEPAPPADFQAWLRDFRRQARTEGISEATLSRALDGVRSRPRVIELDRSQPEFVRPIWP